ncbi:MAG TPA: hypothetical protein VNW99_03070 [Cytophagaceae bacterium]|jgi:hypothetical protein|nr:hypothetical protein [Cytophagaceae bacterium]
MKKNILLIALIICTLSCKKDNSIDTKLIGKWSDFNALYQFNTDFTYHINYLSVGSGKDSVKIDSAFGTYELDKKRVNVTFNQKGYRHKYTGVVLFQTVNPITWHYSIQSDTILNYNSNTSLGILYKQ